MTHTLHFDEIRHGGGTAETQQRHGKDTAEAQQRHSRGTTGAQQRRGSPECKYRRRSGLPVPQKIIVRSGIFPTGRNPENRPLRKVLLSFQPPGPKRAGQQSGRNGPEKNGPEKNGPEKTDRKKRTGKNGPDGNPDSSGAPYSYCPDLSRSTSSRVRKRHAPRLRFFFVRPA